MCIHQRCGLVSGIATCQSDVVDRKRFPVAGGFAVMVLTVAGAFWGLSHGWGSAGMLIGLGAGLGVAALIWAIDRAR